MLQIKNFRHAGETFENYFKSVENYTKFGEILFPEDFMKILKFERL